MKLRKALERAKNERNECGQDSPGAGGNGKQKTEECRQAPVYSDSTECFLNPAVAEKNRGVCLIDYFLDDTPINDLIIWPGVEKLTLISGNRTIIDASELLSSGVMRPGEGNGRPL